MKKTIILIILFTFILSTVSIANTIQYEEKAISLKELGLFNGNDKGFELERTPSRIEAMIMLIRLLGKEKESVESNYTHPFTDVPNWADKQIGYLYENEFISGIGNNLLGSKQLISAKSYATLMLRVLGYDDNKGDFKWSTALKKANELNMLDEDELANLSKKQFLRDDMVNLTFNSLNIALKDESNKSLALKLVLEGVISKEIAISKGLIEEVPMTKLFSSTPINLTNSDRIKQYPKLTNEINIESLSTGNYFDGPIPLRISVDRNKLPNAYSLVAIDEQIIDRIPWDKLMDLEKNWKLNDENSTEYLLPSLYSVTVFIILDDSGDILGYSAY